MLRLINGLESLIPNVKFKGDLRENSERLYNSIEILDNVKPSYEDVYQASLDYYRKEIANSIDNKTSEKITYEFIFSEDTNSNKFKTDLQWQFNIQTIYMNKNNLTYPYYLKINSDNKGMPIYFTIQDSSQFDRLYTELFQFINQWLYSGWQEKTKISNMTEEELVNYVDVR